MSIRKTMVSSSWCSA